VCGGAANRRCEWKESSDYGGCRGDGTGARTHRTLIGQSTGWVIALDWFVLLLLFHPISQSEFWRVLTKYVLQYGPLSLHVLTAIFSRAGTRMSPFWILLELRIMELVVTTGAIRRTKLQSNHHHQQTNTRFFEAGYALPVAQPTASARARGKCHPL